MNHAETIISDWFQISTDDAIREEKEIMDLVSAHGADTSNSLVIEKAIYRSLGSRYPWKNLKKKQEFEEDKKLTVQAYNGYINQRNRN